MSAVSCLLGFRKHPGDKVYILKNIFAVGSLWDSVVGTSWLALHFELDWSHIQLLHFGLLDPFFKKFLHFELTGSLHFRLVTYLFVDDFFNLFFATWNLFWGLLY